MRLADACQSQSQYQIQWPRESRGKRTYLKSIRVHNPEDVVAPIPGQDLEAFRAAMPHVQYNALDWNAVYRVAVLTWQGLLGESSQKVSRPHCPSLHKFDSAAGRPKLYSQ